MGGGGGGQGAGSRSRSIRSAYLDRRARATCRTAFSACAIAGLGRLPGREPAFVAGGAPSCLPRHGTGLPATRCTPSQAGLGPWSWAVSIACLGPAHGGDAVALSCSGWGGRPRWRSPRPSSAFHAWVIRFVQLTDLGDVLGPVAVGVRVQRGLLQAAVPARAAGSARLFSSYSSAARAAASSRALGVGGASPRSWPGWSPRAGVRTPARTAIRAAAGPGRPGPPLAGVALASSSAGQFPVHRLDQ